MSGVLVLAAGRRACVHRPRLHGGDPRLRRHARRDGRPVAARLTLRREQPPCDPASTRAASRSSRSAGSSCWSLPAVPGRIAFIVLIGAELAIPVIAERQGTTPWHPHHITERYGLFTLILLGESLLASANADHRGPPRRSRPSARPDLDRRAGDGRDGRTLVDLLLATAPHGHPRPRRAPCATATSTTSSSPPQAPSPQASRSRSTCSPGTANSATSPRRSPSPSRSRSSCSASGGSPSASNADRVVNVALPLGAVLVLFDPIIPIPITLTAVIMVLMVVVLVLHPPVTAHTDKPAL